MYAVSYCDNNLIISILLSSLTSDEKRKEYLQMKDNHVCVFVYVCFYDYNGKYCIRILGKECIILCKKK